MKKITTHPNAVYTAVWRNGAKIEVLYFPDPLADEDVSDRIQLLVTPANAKPRGWILNIEDATEIIYGLSKAMQRAITDRIPVGAFDQPQPPKGKEK